MIVAYDVGCNICGTTKTFLLNPEDIRRWKSGTLIQKVWPKMPVGDRELLISNTCDPCFKKMFSEEDE